MSLAPLIALIALAAPAPIVTAPDPGMWTFDNLPLEHLKQVYGFEPTRAWINHVRLASVRISSGGSGSFVSPNGLVLTNHHVALEYINGMSSPANDYVTNGFHARRHAQERKCKDATLRQLVSMTDVTAEVEKAGKGATDPARARANAIGEITARLSNETELTVDVVTLYGGAQYVAYAYKIYDDVRLVFAPELRAAAFGGDLDNFCYPRWCLDVAFLRAYENGKPADTSAHYFRWSGSGAKRDELVFVSGNPGSTARLWPQARLEHERDVYNPGLLELLGRREQALSRYAALGGNQKIKVLDELFGIRNSLKAIGGELDGLRNARIWSRKQAEEKAFLKAAGEDAEVEKAMATYVRTRAMRNQAFVPLVFLRIDGELGGLARAIARLGSALASDEASRPANYRGASLKQMMSNLAEEIEFDLPLERERISANLDNAVKMLGKDSDYVKVAVGNLKPRAAADRLLSTTRLTEATFREKLLKGGAEAINGSTDPLLVLARIVESQRRGPAALWGEAGNLEAAAGTSLAQARFRIFGKTSYPDATFTLRLSYGTCKGYDLGTTRVPWKTTLYGLFGRGASMNHEEPFDIPARWEKAKPFLDLATPYNFVNTVDSTGGNSGSPCINKNLEIVGVLFDGNIQSLPNRYLYLDDVCRSVCVHSAGIAHALERVYGAYGLLAELSIK
ncbi:MAG: hypothetical protein CL910_10445 [Deltaproteobacteria bacterium]|nr:hypothetical protein [Deltaproteobacteria bacterium]